MKDISKDDLFSEKNLLIEGPRGCGKTMLLRWMSFEVQATLSKKNNESLLETIRNKGGIGIYLDIPTSTLAKFRRLMGREKDGGHWDGIFEHYFELRVAERCLDFLLLLEDHFDLDGGQVDTLEQKLAVKLDLPEAKSIKDLRKQINKDIREVDRYRGNFAFTSSEFEPRRTFSTGELTVGIPEEVCRGIEGFGDVRLLLCIDSYRDFNERQQRRVNSLIRQANRSVGFRIGMRPVAFRTAATAEETEPIRPGHDYRKVIFEDPVNNREEYREFLKDLANRRLEFVQDSLEEDVDLDIVSILGESPNHEAEARRIVEESNRADQHFRLLKDKFDEQDYHEIKERISYPENPLLELLNVRYVLRGISPKAVASAMDDYVDPGSSGPQDGEGEGLRYREDYIDKYKLSLLFLLARLYRTEKEYYSFRILTYLSSGIPRNFLRLCKEAFYRAHYHRRQDSPMAEDATPIPADIPRKVQHEAALHVARQELDFITTIKDHGPELLRLAQNLGRVFEEFHADRKLRYPELNEFSVDLNSEENIGLLQEANRRSVIQEKNRHQASGPGTTKKKPYILNRIFCPVFNISYRTRGGYRPVFNDAQFKHLVEAQEINSNQLGLRIAGDIPRSQTSLRDF